jgi:hypothetical protein
MARRGLTHAHVSMTSGYATRHGQLRCATPPVASAPASWLMAAQVTPRVPWPQLLSLAHGSSGAATRSVAPTPASWHRAALELPCVSWLHLPPPGSRQLWSHHVFHGSSSHLLAQGSSEVTTCPMELYGLRDIEVNKYPLMALPS